HGSSHGAPLSLRDALPISRRSRRASSPARKPRRSAPMTHSEGGDWLRAALRGEITGHVRSLKQEEREEYPYVFSRLAHPGQLPPDRKSTRLYSSHVKISYA